MIRHFTEKQLAVIDTKIEHYEVVERQYESRPARVLFSGQRRAAQSGIALDDNPDLLFDYNQRLLELANACYPQRILVIGGGAFTLPVALLTALPQSIVTVVELDEALHSIATEHFGLTPHDRLHIVFQDGRQFLDACQEKFDLIILDVFSELQIPTSFLTVEVNDSLAKCLTTTGCVALNIIASYQGRNAGLIKSQIAAYNRNFDTVTVYPAAHGLTSWMPQNLLLVAQRGVAKNLNEYLRFAPIDSISCSDADLRYDS